ncbi:MAG: amidohydrolase family protein [Oscillospiraceae bacterium]|nr:amidohydrolase family protein [Oscillospiraceae bacterium]
MFVKIIQGNLVYSPTLSELKTLPHGALVLDEGGVLRDVLPHAPAGADAEVHDYGDALVMPSFVDMHLHAPQYPMLGMGMDLPLMDWLNTYTFRTEARFADADYARRTYRRLARELITGGTTRVCMFSSLHTDATLILMEELERAGVTGYVGKVNMDRNSGDALRETTEQSKRETLRWLDACADFRHIRPILTPRFTPSCTDDLMAWLGALAEERGLYVQSHLSENGGEIALVKELHPDCSQYWETYAKYGLWKDHTVMAHCVHSDAREREALRRHNVVVAHCAGSNINICSGVAPVRTMLDEGVWVTLGSDIAGGAQLAMNRVITMSIRASKILHMKTDGETAFLTVNEAYYLGSTAGHRYFGADGGFAVGQPLHAIVVDDSVFAEPVRPLDLRERFERSIYLMDPGAICAVWSDGRQVVGGAPVVPGKGDGNNN